MKRTTPTVVDHLEPGEIFVFGSNLAGRHGKGAARTACMKFGAVYGQGAGPMGRSYGIPTKGWRLETLPLPEIQKHVEYFLKHARGFPELVFLVTEIGCGLAGYTPAQIAPLFGADLPDNVVLPASFI